MHENVRMQRMNGLFALPSAAAAGKLFANHVIADDPVRFVFCGHFHIGDEVFHGSGRNGAVAMLVSFDALGRGHVKIDNLRSVALFFGKLDQRLSVFLQDAGVVDDDAFVFLHGGPDNGFLEGKERIDAAGAVLYPLVPPKDFAAIIKRYGRVEPGFFGERGFAGGGKSHGDGQDPAGGGKLTGRGGGVVCIRHSSATVVIRSCRFIDALPSSAHPMGFVSAFYDLKDVCRLFQWFLARGGNRLAAVAKNCRAGKFLILSLLHS